MSVFKASFLFLLSSSLVHGVPHSSRASRSQQCVVPPLHNARLTRVIIFEEGVNYNIFQPITATNLSNVEIRMHGNLHLPQNITAVQNIVSDGTSTWFTLEGPKVDWIGPEDVNNGWIDSYGQPWWDANPAGSSGIDNRPHLMSFKSSQATMKYFRSRKPIAWNVKLHGQDITVSHAIIDATSTGSFPFNTDGFDVEGTNIQITDSIMYNGDDAIAKHHRLPDSRHEHGSLGKDPTDFANISNIRFDDVTVVDGLYAARFKSWSGGTGLVKNVTWNNIRVFNVTFPIFVTQSYSDQGASRSGTVNASSAVMMEDFTWSDFAGSINTYQPGDGSCVSDPCWYNVGLPNLKHTEALIIECHTAQSCKNFVTDNIQLYPQVLEPASVICMNATAALNPDLGFTCKNGTYSPLSN
ncbi:uncharacterized protein An02g12450 [Aspergillus niger]|uniref:galacturonan 1,4-alpha-galacturonidase n=1 Tax=Aspergillus niger TaxID=5061 RepID=A0AAJ8E142_ASPNG|nr:uncharacterized protein An02g12450 [Aspergillus niger]CAK44512.1 unnamed protein product [Aspergillus niger]